MIEEIENRFHDLNTPPADWTEEERELLAQTNRMMMTLATVISHSLPPGVGFSLVCFTPRATSHVQDVDLETLHRRLVELCGRIAPEPAEAA